MPSHYARDLKRKFDEMAADLSKVLAGKANKVLCPLCLREFEESDIEENLTEEHVIPSSAGGRITTLTCRTCNHRLAQAVTADQNEIAVFIPLF